LARREAADAPLTASYHRIRRKKSHNVAVVALARKLVVVVWHLLTHQEPYRYAPARSALDTSPSGRN
jgi:hypothetical protein